MKKIILKNILISFLILACILIAILIGIRFLQTNNKNDAKISITNSTNNLNPRLNQEVSGSSTDSVKSIQEKISSSRPDVAPEPQSIFPTDNAVYRVAPGTSQSIGFITAANGTSTQVMTQVVFRKKGTNTWRNFGTRQASGYNGPTTPLNIRNQFINEGGWSCGMGFGSKPPKDCNEIWSNGILTGKSAFPGFKIYFPDYNFSAGEYEWSTRAVNMSNNKLSGWASLRKFRVVEYDSFYDYISLTTGDKKVALTFDDGPYTSTQAFCDVLNTYNSKATFFFVGNRLYSNQVKIAESCGEVANHGGTHVTAFTPDISYQTAFNEIKSGNDALKNATSKSIKWFRPMQGIYNIDNVKKAVNDNHQSIVNYDVMAYDWGRPGIPHPTSQQIIDNILNKSDLHSGAIILMHQTYPETIKALPDILKGLISKGYRVTTVTDVIDSIPL